jgi:hypothetical protein
MVLVNDQNASDDSCRISQEVMLVLLNSRAATVARINKIVLKAKCDRQLCDVWIKS